eukprot:GHVU01095651.1.p1 GENE.GHVU01095651.1~~GHVU01095651.1.p1  ORF type:complete len:112 (+),score=10.08 GHVU01095651.1:204-539(+)
MSPEAFTNLPSIISKKSIDSHSDWKILYGYYARTYTNSRSKTGVLEQIHKFLVRYQSNAAHLREELILQSTEGFIKLSPRSAGRHNFVDKESQPHWDVLMKKGKQREHTTE